MSTSLFILHIIGVFLFGIGVSIILYIFLSVKNKNTSDYFFCNSNKVNPKFSDYEISIDEACKKFELLDI